MRRRLSVAVSCALFGLAAAIASACRDPSPDPERARDLVSSSGALTIEEQRAAERPGAQPGVFATLRSDREAKRSPADGGGRAWLEPAIDEAERTPVRVGEWRRFRLVYEAGPLGIAEGGAIFFQVSPFFGWSTVQTRSPDGPGYTTFSTDAAGVRLDADRADNPYLLPISIHGRALRSGERVVVVYGAGPRRAQVDRFAERDERFWFHVDGDGDGVRGTVGDSPRLDILPGPAVRAVLTLPGTARPGETVPLTIALLDADGNAGIEVAATLVLRERPAGLELPETVSIDPAQRGVLRIDVPVIASGVMRVLADVQGLTRPISVESNPMLVLPDLPRLLWGDLHGHTNWSDGTGVPEDYLLYARDVAALDVLALTDHDHWGTPFLDASPERWKQLQALTDRFHAPGRFVTISGFEWTSWLYGHRHVLYFDEPGPVISSLDPKTETPTQLWAALRGRQALTIAHHSAGGPVSIDWSFTPDPVLEPVTEIASVHGSSEAPDSPLPIYDPIPGDWVREQLVKGDRLGFIASGDSHDGHPGLPQLAAPSGGLAGIWSEEKTRESVLEALRARRTYGTNGPRIVLRASLGGRRVGSTLAAGTAASPLELAVHVVSPGPLARIDVIRGREVAQSLDAEGRRELTVRWEVPPLEPGDFLYVRAVQQDGGAAWASPWFIE